MLKTGKYRESFLSRLGWASPRTPHPESECIWIHAVSVGEVRAAAALIAQLKQRHPTVPIVLSTITETGQAEARKIKQLEHCLYLPFDLYPCVYVVMRRYRPRLVLLCETDIWPCFLRRAQRQGAQLAIVNAKLSERSARRLLRLRPAARLLYGPIDAVCAQNAHYAQRFAQIGIDASAISVTGNLKFDIAEVDEERAALEQQLAVQAGGRFLTLGSTHVGEEAELIQALSPLLERMPDLKLLVVPRHPERFDEVWQVVTQLKFKAARYSAMSAPDARLILIDTMGMLRACYALSECAIVAGSFSSGVGGHNVLEPIAAGAACVFGPAMHQQAELRDLLLEGEGALQVPIDGLEAAVTSLLGSSTVRDELLKRGRAVLAEHQGSAAKTAKSLDKLLDASFSDLGLAAKKTAPLYS
jgi:3-deoxy-D-manno-octulosonic-acid transferase